MPMHKLRNWLNWLIAVL